MSESVYEECLNFKSIMSFIKTQPKKIQEISGDFKKMRSHLENAKNFEHMNLYDSAIREYDKTVELIDGILKLTEKQPNQKQSNSSDRDIISCGRTMKTEFSQIFGVNKEYLQLVKETSKVQMNILILKRDIKSNAAKCEKVSIGENKVKDNNEQQIEEIAKIRISTLDPIKKRICDCIEEIKVSVNNINPSQSIQFCNSSMYQKMSFNENSDSPQYIIMLYSRLVHNFMLVEMLIRNSTEYYRKKAELYLIYKKNKLKLPEIMRMVEIMMKEKLRLSSNNSNNKKI